MSGTPSFSIATPSYAGDIERCRLLCASIDHFVSGLATHYLLVEDADVALFRQLEGPRRRVIAESELFPRWLRAWPDPLSFGRRRIWTGAGALRRGLRPLRGWHTQQLRKLALPGVTPEDVVLYADSDVIFIRPFHLAEQMSGGRARLYRKPGGIAPAMPDHAGWTRQAARALGLPEPSFPADDYINNLATWRRPNVEALRAHLEQVSGDHWMAAAARGRGFSEMLLYGMFVDLVLGDGALHEPRTDELARTYWVRKDVAEDSFGAEAVLTQRSQVAIGVQSFISVPMEDLWAVFRRAAATR